MYTLATVFYNGLKETAIQTKSHKISETCVEINSHDLLNLTVARLLMYLDEVMETISEEERCDLILICKWGCDGSQQAQYKRKFENDSSSDAYPDSNFSLQQACHKFVMTRVQVCHKFVMTSVQACSKLAAS
ncbi:hypothetical protein AVEN_265602-1 [Araneus ventricosus]|uniref:Uncharacterized protein n=1 Tax=Araneus ventricosus TaxID=182803 RepID=A0A4Y2X1I5_ARAVE|nr:hypothetical protein AVEN_265602-1 [Araneus ventricosus]